MAAGEMAKTTNDRMVDCIMAIIRCYHSHHTGIYTHSFIHYNDVHYNHMIIRKVLSYIIRWLVQL
jgi:hypothetical protein